MKTEHYFSPLFVEMCEFIVDFEETSIERELGRASPIVPDFLASKIPTVDVHMRSVKFKKELYVVARHI